jgi:hypothetical protein
MSTIKDVVTNNSASISDIKKAHSEKSRQIVQELIDAEVRQFIVDRSTERRNKNVNKDDVTSSD